MNVKTLEGSFSKFQKPDFLTGNNKYFCSKCKAKRNASKRFVFKKCKYYIKIPIISSKYIYDSFEKI